ncbi:hypothetical protein EES43_26130 [Streptomyces sp. ADI96-02]|uniref:hypothetical protein n=1 Tax=unclassified Streptomyces TaxID=2593676 RepID=UPI000F5555C3|nr:hypothetical protein [Streptomyces sp. ADI96-02]RPK55605.1 hypothetical protein EES43_26130 [Streptomyces sp. ADI96-02]
MTTVSVSARTYRQRCRSGVPAPLGWVFLLLAVFLCCAVGGPAASVPVAAGGQGPAQVRAMTPTPQAAVEHVATAAPAERGLGTSCHGGSNHAAAVVLPVPTAPVALPSPVALAPAAPLTGATAIRGPAHDGVRCVDHLRLQVQRI